MFQCGIDSFQGSRRSRRWPQVSPQFFFFYHLLLVNYPPSSLYGTQPKPATCVEVNAFGNACPTSGVSPPLPIGGQKHPFRQLHNLTASLTAYIFGTKHDTENWILDWKLQGVSYIVL